MRIDHWRAATLLLVLVALAGCRSGAVNDYAWHEVQSEHFTVITNEAAPDAIELAQKLERFRAIVLHVSGATIGPESVPTKIFLFSDWASFFEYTGGPHVLGFTWPTLRANYIVIGPGVYHTSQERVIYHEYVHYLLRKHRAKFPGWYDEGLAEMLSNIQTDSGDVVIGNVPREGINVYARAWFLPLREVLNHDVDLGGHDAHTAAYYAQAWATVHFMLAGGAGGMEDRSDELSEYLTLLNDNVERGTAFDQAFNGLSYRGLTSEVRRYMRKRRLPGLRVPEAELSFSSHYELRPLPVSDAASELGELVLLKRNRAPLAQELFEHALLARPTNVQARSGLAMALAYQEQYQRAVSEAQQAITDDPELSNAHLDFARILFGVCRAGLADDAPEQCLDFLEAARSHLERSLALNPQSAESHANYGLTLAQMDDDLHAAIRHLNTANDLATWIPQLSYELGRLYLRTDQPTLAERSLTNVIRWSNNSTLKAQAQVLLDHTADGASAPGE